MTTAANGCRGHERRTAVCMTQGMQGLATLGLQLRQVALVLHCLRKRCRR